MIKTTLEGLQKYFRKDDSGKPLSGQHITIVLFREKGSKELKNKVFEDFKPQKEGDPVIPSSRLAEAFIRGFCHDIFVGSADGQIEKIKVAAVDWYQVRNVDLNRHFAQKEAG